MLGALICLVTPTHALLAATPARAAQPIMQVTPPPRTSGKASRPRVSVAKPKRPAAKPTPARPAARGSADARYAAKGWNPSWKDSMLPSSSGSYLAARDANKVTGRRGISRTGYDKKKITLAGPKVVGSRTYVDRRAQGVASLSLLAGYALFFKPAPPEPKPTGPPLLPILGAAAALLAAAAAAGGSSPSADTKAAAAAAAPAAAESAPKAEGVVVPTEPFLDPLSVQSASDGAVAAAAGADGGSGSLG
mmetsp:Transcript_28049/g.89975  ORF Transcript_28049/g.89975 Transcript_28049/m.89975 type:complete len:249 (-) Transcript_28049:407-1153(-)